jgi:hypothetical protein
MASSQRFHETGSVTIRHTFFKSRLTQEIAGEVLFADVLLLPNGMSKVGAIV